MAMQQPRTRKQPSGLAFCISHSTSEGWVFPSDFPFDLAGGLRPPPLPLQVEWDHLMRTPFDMTSQVAWDHWSSCCSKVQNLDLQRFHTSTCSETWEQKPIWARICLRHFQCQNSSGNLKTKTRDKAGVTRANWSAAFERQNESTHC